MAAITSANVTTTSAWRMGDIGNKYQGVLKNLQIVLSSQGGTLGDIPASALGFTKILSVMTGILMVSTTPKGVVVGVASDGTELIPIDLTQATDANRTARANITGTLYISVLGVT